MSWHLDPEETNDKLKEDYYEWLEETCKCMNVDECECLTLDEWIEQLPEPDIDDEESIC